MIFVARESIRIARARQEIFPALQDLEQMPRWFPGVVSMRSADDLAPSSVGKRYDEVVRIPLRGEQSSQVEIVECVPGESLAFQANLAPVRPRFDLLLRDAGAGETELVWTCRARSTGPGLRLGAPVMGAIMGRRARQALARLKGQLETGRQTMRAVETTAFGAADRVLRVTNDAPLPEPGPGDVLVRVEASSVNPIDCRRRGGYGRRLLGARGAASPPLVLGRDVAGVVVSVGSGVRRFRVGDAVWGAVDNFRAGAWAGFVAADESNLGPRPTNLTSEQAAALPYAALSAWAALVGHAGLDAKSCQGQRVLVHAGAGGVGSFAIQLLKAWGAEVATTCSGRNRDFVISLGADHVVDYTRERYADRLRDYDVALDTLGGDHEDPTLAVLKRGAGARYVTLVHPLLDWTDRFGLVLGGARAGARLIRRKAEQRLRFGRQYGWSLFQPDPGALEEIRRLVEAERIRPVIERAMPLAEMAEAHALVEAGHTRGKIVIRVDDRGA